MGLAVIHPALSEVVLPIVSRNIKTKKCGRSKEKEDIGSFKHKGPSKKL